MEDTLERTDKTPNWLERPLGNVITINWETVLFTLLMIAAVFTRFYDLETRVMSHDESLHTYYSWRLFKGFGFEHTPLMHGPLQFHFIALSYFLFGDSDFSARIFAALTSIATIGIMWKYRRYLGRTGALVAAFLLTISPFMMYYGRYVRNEAYVGLFGVALIWAILRYLDTGEYKYLLVVTASTVLHFTAKETAFIYSFQAVLFLGFLFVRNVTQREWPNPDQRRAFLIVLIVAFLCFGASGGLYFGGRGGEFLSPTATAAPANPDEVLTGEGISANQLAVYFGGFGMLALAGGAFFLLAGYGLNNLRRERTFDLIILLTTLVLPMGAPFVIRALGWNPMDYSSQGILRSAAVVVPVFALTLAIGWFWNLRVWLINAALYYAVFTVFYTTLFTNGLGFFTGLVGSLGYWLEQQAVKRGNQPWYYYLLIQIPIYEYLPLLGSLLALALGIRRSAAKQDEDEEETEFYKDDDYRPGENGPTTIEEPEPVLLEERIVETGEGVLVPLLGFWVLSSLAAYTLAGEKMPWLTFHIALPMILLTGWALGQVIDRIDWAAFREKGGPLALALLFVFIPGAIATVFTLLGSNPPFQGSELTQLQATSTFMLALLSTAASGWGLWAIARSWAGGQLARLAVIGFFALLTLLTTRTAVTATFIHHDQATEYLVYAHSAGPVKEVLAQAEEISRRTAGDLSMAVAYDNDVSWPFTWYMRNYPNHRYYGESPTRDLRDVPFIVVGDDNFDKLLPVVGQAYYQFDYIRMWWPNQDYFNLTWDRVRDAVTNPQMRAALFNIWFNRDYTLYGQLTNNDLSLANWYPSDRMRLYIRKDIAAEIWEFGIGPSSGELVADPYEGKGITLPPDLFFGASGDGPGQLNAPRGVAVGADGTIYVADSRNHRIQQFSRDGEPLNTWGSFADAATGNAPGGTFNEPWDLAVGPDGSVLVADTWNHRVQRFSADGEFLAMWGFFGAGEAPEAFWGPRSVAVSADGRVFVTDTGNKRIVVFTLDGEFVTEFGEVGFSPGQFDEPVGLALDGLGQLFVADTWNQRIQVLTTDGIPIRNWELFAWFGDSLDNKPYIAVDGENDRVYIADPEGYRILEYTLAGEFIRYWGDYSTGSDGFGLVSGLALDADGGLWVTDGLNNRVLHFQP